MRSPEPLELTRSFAMACWTKLIMICCGLVDAALLEVPDVALLEVPDVVSGVLPAVVLDAVVAVVSAAGVVADVDPGAIEVVGLAVIAVAGTVVAVVEVVDPEAAGVAAAVAAALLVACWYSWLEYDSFRLKWAISVGSIFRLAAAANAPCASPEKNWLASESTCETTLLMAFRSSLLKLPLTSICIPPLAISAAADALLPSAAVCDAPNAVACARMRMLTSVPSANLKLSDSLSRTSASMALLPVRPVVDVLRLLVEPLTLPLDVLAVPLVAPALPLPPEEKGEYP